MPKTDDYIERLVTLLRQGQAAPPEDVWRVLEALREHQTELETQNRELSEARSCLEESRKRYAELYDYAPVGYASVDRNGVVEAMNQTGARLLGRNLDRLIGMPFAPFLANPAAFLSHLRECERGQRPQQLEVQLVVDRGGERVLQLTTAPYASRTGTAAAFRMTITDVSDHKRAEAESAMLEVERRARLAADEANQVKDQFLGIVSHELRTPLTAILGWTRLLGARRGDPEFVGRAADVLMRNGETLTRLVDDLLDVSRIVHGKLRVQPEPIDLGEVVSLAVEQARIAAASKKLTVRTSIAPDCRVRADALRLQQVLSNLLSNAIKFTNPGGQIEVALERRASRIRVAVRDDGCGIDPEDLPYIFALFRQGDSTTSRSHGGLGLG